MMCEPSIKFIGLYTILSNVDACSRRRSVMVLKLALAVYGFGPVQIDRTGEDPRSTDRERADVFQAARVRATAATRVTRVRRNQGRVPPDGKRPTLPDSFEVVRHEWRNALSGIPVGGSPIGIRPMVFSWDFGMGCRMISGIEYREAHIFLHGESTEPGKIRCVYRLLGLVHTAHLFLQVSQKPAQALQRSMPALPNARCPLARQ